MKKFILLTMIMSVFGCATHSTKTVTSPENTVIKMVKAVDRRDYREVELNDNTAKTHSYVYASHTAEGLEHWDLFGSYEHQLLKTGEKRDE